MAKEYNLKNKVEISEENPMWVTRPKTMQNKTVVRMGIIGCGAMTNMAHLTACKMLEDEGFPIKVTAVCDISKEKADDAAQTLECKSYTDYRDLVNDVDAVLIVTPHNTHYEIAKFYLENNKHILLEKPLCNTREEVVDLIRISEERDLTFQCAYPVPYWLGVVKLKELLESGEYGDIIQMSIWTEQLTGYGFPDRSRTKEMCGGGQLFCHGCHYIDVLLDFLGDPEYGVHVGTNVGTPWMEGEGTSNVSIKFKNGTLAYHFGTWGAKGTWHDGYCFHVLTTKGMFNYSDGESYLGFDTRMDPDPNKRGVVKWIVPREEGHATHHEIMHFIECINDHKIPRTNPRRALRSLDVIWRMYEAEENGTLADLSDL